MVNNLDALYAALADPTRRGMLERLRSGPLSVTELGAPYGMTLAAVGKHVAVLEAAGILTTKKSGRVRSCTIVPRALDDASRWITEQERFWHSRVDQLEHYLEES